MMPQTQLYSFSNIIELVQDIDETFVKETYVNPDRNKELGYKEYRTLNIVAKTDVIKQIYSLITKKNNLVKVDGKYEKFEEDYPEVVEKKFNDYDILHLVIADDGVVYLETLDYYKIFKEDYDMGGKPFAFIQQGIDNEYILEAERYHVPTLWFSI